MKKRIAIIGCGGAGKSTLARALGEKLDLPVTHLDALFWKPGWVAISHEELHAVQNAITDQPEWIIDGNYGSTLDTRLASAETIIYLDFPTGLCLWRVIKRRIDFRGRTRPDMGAGCPEKIDLEFLRWIWNYRRRKRPDVLARLEQCCADGKQVVQLCSPAQVHHFLENLSR